MVKWLFVLFWILLIGVFLKKTGSETTDTLISENYSICRSSKGYVFVLFSVPFVFIAFRTIFVDTYSYIAFFIQKL